MLTDFTGADRVYIACGYTDLRCGIDGLASLVQQQFQLDPFNNTLFLFCGRRRDRIKALYWEGNGFVLLCRFDIHIIKVAAERFVPLCRLLCNVRNVKVSNIAYFCLKRDLDQIMESFMDIIVMMCRNTVVFFKDSCDALQPYSVELGGILSGTEKTLPVRDGRQITGVDNRDHNRFLLRFINCRKFDFLFLGLPCSFHGI